MVKTKKSKQKQLRKIQSAECKSYNQGINKGRKELAKEVLNLIDKQRDNGNLSLERNNWDNRNGFSPALCLSDIIKYCEEVKQEAVQSEARHSSQA